MNIGTAASEFNYYRVSGRVRERVGNAKVGSFPNTVLLLVPSGSKPLSQAK